MMKRFALILACFASACASSTAANPNDPVDMAAQLGDRGRQYVGMGAVCDGAAGGAYRQSIVDTVRVEQQRLGVLSDLVDRAYRGEASETLSAHMRTQMNAHGLSATEFCGAVVQMAAAELDARATSVLTLSGSYDAMAYARHTQHPPYNDLPTFDPFPGYTAWVE